MLLITQLARKVLGHCPMRRTKPCVSWRLELERLEDRLTPATYSVAAGALEITDFANPNAPMTWADPSALATNIVRANDQLYATLAVTITFTPVERAQLNRLGTVDL